MNTVLIFKILFQINVKIFLSDSLEKKWKRTETEGPFVVFSRIDEPFYSLLVVDRKQRGKEDFLQPLVPGIKLTNKSPYIFISGRQDSKIFWFFVRVFGTPDYILATFKISKKHFFVFFLGRRRNEKKTNDTYPNFYLSQF